MPRRSLTDRLGVYRRDGRVVRGRSPYIGEEQWKKIEDPSPFHRLLAALGLAYAPDRTRRKPFGGRTKD